MRPSSPLIAALLFAAALPVLAQRGPSDLQPIPEPPPPPPGLVDQDLEPQVTITRRGEDKVEEFRMNGRLYMMKVTPLHGVPYYLIDNRGDGDWTRRDSMDSGIRVPQWVIGTF